MWACTPASQPHLLPPLLYASVTVAPLRNLRFGGALGRRFDGSTGAGALASCRCSGFRFRERYPQTITSTLSLERRPGFVAERSARRSRAMSRQGPDLVERRFEATAPNQLWMADITYVATWAVMASSVRSCSRRCGASTTPSPTRPERDRHASWSMFASEDPPRGHISDKGRVGEPRPTRP